MKRRYVWLALSALVVVGAALSLPSCGNEKQLVNVQVRPATVIYPTPNSGQVDFSAIGTFIHPPSTQNITTQVTWSTDIPELLTLNFQGVAGAVAPSGAGCGIANIIATGIANIIATGREGTGGSGNIVIGYATVTVNDPTNPLCPGGSATQSVVVVSVAPALADGNVTSTPAGINCGPSGPCGAQFTVGNTIVLAETPATGHTFVGWTGCTPISGTTCSLQVPAAGANPVATFTP